MTVGSAPRATPDTVPSMRNARSLALLLVAPLLAVAACSSDSSVDAAPYVDAVREDVESNESGGFSLDGDAAQCVAESLVEAADADKLDEAGVTPEDFAAADSFDDVDAEFDDDELRSSLTNSLSDCELGASLTDVFVSEFPFELADEEKACVADSLDEGDELSPGLADSLVDGDDAGIQDAFSTALVDCPQVTGSLLSEVLTQSGVPVSDEARACITDEMEQRGEEGVEQLIGGGAEAQGLGEEIGVACLSDISG